MNGIKGTMFMVIAASIVSSWVSCAFFQRTLPGLTLSDADIVSMMNRLNEGAIDAAQLAREKASNPHVRAFAGRVLNEHRGLAEGNGRLAAQLSLHPSPPALATNWKRTHERAMRELRTMSGPAFDQAYVRHEIQQHVQAFNFFEAAAKSETTLALKQELVRTGPDLLSHISAARALERHLGSEQPAIATR
jgi:putative membrane protein